MPKFSYKAKAEQNKIQTGVIEAENIKEAIRKITLTGSTPLDVSPYEPGQKQNSPGAVQPRFFRKKVKLKDIVLFTRELSDLIEASVPMLKSLQLISHQTTNSHLKSIIMQMEEDVTNGSSLADALQQSPDIFSNLYVELVRTGEASGRLAQVLRRLSNHMDKEQETRSKIISALAYPCLVLVIGCLTMIVFISFVIPRISLMFEGLGQALPWITTVLIEMSTFFVHYGWLIVILIVGFFLWIYRYTQTPSGQLKIDALKLKIPVFGSFLKIVQIAHVARTLDTLIKAGIPITTALNLMGVTIENAAFREEMVQIPEQIAQGTKLHKAFEQTHFFPEMVIHMISVGEETGELDQSFEKIAGIYERQSDELLRTVLSLLGPIVLVAIVLVIGLMLIAMLLPIFEMNLLI